MAGHRFWYLPNKTFLVGTSLGNPLIVYSSLGPRLRINCRVVGSDGLRVSPTFRWNKASVSIDEITSGNKNHSVSISSEPFILSWNDGLKSGRMKFFKNDPMCWISGLLDVNRHCSETFQVSEEIHSNFRFKHTF